MLLMLLMHVHIVMMGSCRVTGHLMMMMVRIVHQIGNGHTDGDGVTVAAAVMRMMNIQMMMRMMMRMN